MPKDNKGKGTGGVTSDPRFAAVHTDPRFQRFPKAKSKVQVDDRFAGMFNDPSFQVGVARDKRGRKVQGKKRGDDMKRYYRLRDEDEWRRDAGEADAAEEEEDGDEEAVETKGKQAKSGKKGAKAKAAAPAPSSESESGSEEEEEDDEAAKRWARMRGLVGPETSSSESGSGSEEESEEASDSGSDVDVGSDEDGEEGLTSDAEDIEADLEAAEAEFGVGALAANPREDIPLLPDATPRLAAVDLDWEHIRAVDILVALRGFVPRGGSIKSVTVYPSDYGLERMAAEAKSGPQGIWRRRGGKSKRQEKAGSEDDDDEEDESSEEEAEEGGGRSDSDGSGEDGEVDPARLRMYERSKLRWYYAIIECDDAGTASALYDECDGMELMKTACKFDLRFVPDEQSFKGRQVRDTSTEVPSDYEPPVFQTKALQHTNVELTWDKGDEGRRRALSRKLNADDIKEDDFKAYLATDSEGSDSDGGDDAAGGEDAEAIRERYRRLLLGGGASADKERKGKRDWAADGDGSGSEDEEEEEEEDDGTAADRAMEMEVTFSSGLEGLGERLLAKKKEAASKAGESVWDAYLRRRKEKKAEARRLGRVNVDSDDEDSDGDGGFGSDEGGSDGSEGDLPAGVADDPFFQHEGDPFDDPFFNGGGGGGGAGEGSDDEGGRKGKKSGKKGEKGGKKGGKKGGGGADDEAARREAAELEMLLMDEDALLRAGKAGVNGGKAGEGAAVGKKPSKKEKMKAKKAARRAERAAGSDEEDHEEAAGAGFKVNLDDPRFKDLLVAPEFALDPTDPRYAKAGPGAATIAAEVAKRRGKGGAKGGGKAAGGGGRGGAGKTEEAPRSGTGGGSGKADLKLMVASLKRKAAVMGGSGASGKAAKQRK